MTIADWVVAAGLLIALLVGALLAKLPDEEES